MCMLWMQQNIIWSFDDAIAIYLEFSSKSWAVGVGKLSDLLHTASPSPIRSRAIH